MIYTVCIQSKLVELEKINSLVEEFSSKNLLDKETLYELNLITEELISNIIRYGSDTANDGKCKIELNLELNVNGIIVIYIVDNGKEFNLNNEIKAGLPDIKSINEATIGGFGLHLVSNYSDKISYKRLNNKNTITVIKHL